MKKALIITSSILIIAVILILPLIFPAPTDTEEQLYINMPEGRELRVAQFADLHFGVEGETYHNSDEARTKEFMRYIVESEKPDLIVCSGDNIMNSGVSGVEEFIRLMDSYKTPWIFIFGNHDAEVTAPGYRKSDVSAALKRSKSKYLLYNEGYIEGGDENRYGNFSVIIKDSEGEKILGALILFDSGTYSNEKEAYQTITKGQVDWYKKEITALNDLYLKQEDNPCDTVPTIAFSHMQLPEFSIAYGKAERGEGAEFVIKSRGFSFESEKLSPSLFDAFVEMGSTKACFVGHFHVMKYQVKMDGVVLGFGPQTGFSHSGYHSPRSTYVYSISEDFSFTTKECIEPTKN